MWESELFPLPNADLNGPVSSHCWVLNAEGWLTLGTDPGNLARWRCLKASSKQEVGTCQSLLQGVLLAVKLRLAPLVCKLFFKGLLQNILYTPQAYLHQISCTDHSDIQDTWSGAVNLTNISLVILVSGAWSSLALAAVKFLKKWALKQAAKPMSHAHLALDRWAGLKFSEQRTCFTVTQVLPSQVGAKAKGRCSLSASLVSSPSLCGGWVPAILCLSKGVVFVFWDFFFFSPVFSFFL